MKINLKEYLIIGAMLLFWSIAVLLSATAVQADQVPREVTINDKTFVYRNDVWIDTAYQPATHLLYRIGTLSDEYDLFTQAIGGLRPYHQLGDHFLIVYDGWGIEIVNGREAGPFVATETRRPAFLAYSPPHQAPPVLISGSPKTTTPPTLLATNSNNQGLSINLQISWGEFIGLTILMLLLGLGSWKHLKNHQAA